MSALESVVEKLMEHTSNFMNKTMTNLNNQEASIWKLKNQIQRGLLEHS